MLELKNVSYEVNEDQREIEILKNINLKIEERFVAITGPNGGGKSTLAKIIAGILVPTSGQILLDGEDITGMNITERAKAGISFAFQQPVRFKGITVRDLITLAAGKNLTTAEACSYLSEVGLCAQEYINREVNASLSGGELKRIEIAMVIARGTKLSVFDEPEAGIDLWSFNNLAIFNILEVFDRDGVDVDYVVRVDLFPGFPLSIDICNLEGLDGNWEVFEEASDNRFQSHLFKIRVPDVL